MPWLQGRHSSSQAQRMPHSEAAERLSCASARAAQVAIGGFGIPREQRLSEEQYSTSPASEATLWGGQRLPGPSPLAALVALAGRHCDCHHGERCMAMRAVAAAVGLPEGGDGSRMRRG